MKALVSLGGCDLLPLTLASGVDGVPLQTSFSGLEDSCVEMPHGRIVVVDVSFLPRPARFCEGTLPFPKGGSCELQI